MPYLPRRHFGGQYRANDDDDDDLFQIALAMSREDCDRRSFGIAVARSLTDRRTDSMPRPKRDRAAAAIDLITPPRTPSPAREESIVEAQRQRYREAVAASKPSVLTLDSTYVKRLQPTPGAQEFVGDPLRQLLSAERVGWHTYATRIQCGGTNGVEVNDGPLPANGMSVPLGAMEPVAPMCDLTLGGAAPTTTTTTAPWTPPRVDNDNPFPIYVTPQRPPRRPPAAGDDLLATVAREVATATRPEGSSTATVTTHTPVGDVAFVNLVGTGWHDRCEFKPDADAVRIGGKPLRIIGYAAYSGDLARGLSGHYVACLRVGDAWWTANDGTVSQGHPPRSFKPVVLVLGTTDRSYAHKPCGLAGGSNTCFLFAATHLAFGLP
jgi:hypothetical protein